MDKNFRIGIISTTACTLIFLCDMLLGFGFLTLLYTVVIFLSLTWGDIKSLTVAIISALILTFFGLLVKLNYDYIYSYDLMFRLSTICVVIFSGIVSVRQKLIEDSLKSLNDELQLRILARTASSESRVILLEKQIKVLKEMRDRDISNSLNQLDDVINHLKELSEQEMEYIDG